MLRKVSGWIKDCEIGDIRKGGLFSQDASGLEIAHKHVRDCGDNGILVWRSEAGEDGTIVASNRIERIASKTAATGRTATPSMCFARTGAGQRQPHRRLRLLGDAAIGNSCTRLGEVALYAEFSFEGAIMANDLSPQRPNLRHQFH